MLIKGKNGKAPARKRQSKSASSSPKSVRSNSVPKNPVLADNDQAANKLEGDIVCVQGGALEGATGAIVLEEAGIVETARGTDLPNESIELTAITLHQPWASLIAAGKKQYETRSWGTDYRGPIAIHAGKTKNGCAEEILKLLQISSENELPYGSIVAIAELTDCIEMTSWFIAKLSISEKTFGDFRKGRYAWKLENVRAIEPIQAAGKQGLWKWEHRQDWQKKFFGIDDTIKYLDESDSWNPADFGELHHKAEADGQLNLLEWVDTEPPEPGDFKSKAEFQEAYKAWADAQTDEAEEELANFGVDELCNQLWARTEPPNPKDYECREQFEEDYKNWVAAQPDGSLENFEEAEIWNALMDGSICAAESVQDSPMPESNCGEEAPTSSVNGTVTANDSLKSDSLEQSNLPILNLSALPAKSPSPIDQKLSPLPLPANHSAMTEKDAEPTTTETASPTCSEQLQNCSPTLQSLKTLPDSSLALIPPATNQEPISDSSSTPYPQSGSMLNGVLSAAPTFPAPGVEKDCLLLRSPGGLSSSGETRPPGKSRLETQLNQLGLIQDGEVAAPEFLEAGFDLPTGWTNPQEKRTALELAQVQAQQLPIAPKLESQAEIQTTATDEKPSEMLSISGSLLLDSGELIISLNLPPNIGSLTKNELIAMAGEQHKFISNIERKEFELALEKLYRARLIGVYLQEFKKKCQYGEFQNQLKQAGIGERSAQNYMAIAKDWETIESKAQFVALLSEDNERPSLTINWALQAVRDEKKHLKSAMPPKDPDGWRTPNNKDQPVVDLVKKALGGQIYLDPCSDSGCNIPATMRYFKWNDGLAKHNIWEKTVFINPPFSDPFPWVERCCFEFARGNVSAAIMLLKAGVVSNVGTGELINKYASAICHWRGRINFLNDEGNPIKGSDFDCVLIYFGARLDLFRQAFGGRGTIAAIENHYSSVNKKHLLKTEIAEFGNTQAEQKQLAAAVGLGNGRSVLPDMRDADRERMERYDPHTVVDVMSMPPTVPAPPISENLVKPLGEAEIFDETPLATRQFETAKQNTLNDYVTAISGNITEFSDEQLKFLLENLNKEVDRRNNQRNDPEFQQRLRQSLLDKLHS